MEKLYVGAAYYPEVWDEDEVDRDIVRMKEAGVNVVRVAEFAWGKMEPQEGKFDFGWLERAVDKLIAAGIDVIMCTPTCTPPRWLLEKYPETRNVLPDKTRTEVFSRCHPCKSSPVMREKNRIITRELAKRFGKKKGVIGWQIDNEIFPYNEGCYCENCQKKFRTYLKNKYKTVEALNDAWKTARWSLEYASFDDVIPPVRSRWEHPSLQTEWIRFQCGNIISYVNEQAEILHELSDAPVGTDMMATNLLGYYELNEKLDVVQYNHYEPAADLARTAFGYDFLRPVKNRPFWVTETQVGWNGSTFANCGHRPQGASYVNTWLPVAKGAEMVEYWLFRAHPNGHELAHGALFNTAGRAYRVTEEVARAAREFERCAAFLTGTRVQSKIALHYSSTVFKMAEYAPMLQNFSYRDILSERFHKPLRRHNVDVIDTAHPLEGYDVLLSPFLFSAEEHDLPARTLEWVKAGGTWIAGPMTDIMTEYASKYPDAPHKFLEELAGVYEKFDLPLGNSDTRVTWSEGGMSAFDTCFAAYDLRGAKALAVFANGEFKGLPAVTERKVGKGKVIVLGGVPDEEALLRLVGVAPVAPASSNVALVARSGRTQGIIALETEGRAGTLTLAGTYTDLLTGKRCTGGVALAPYEVLVLEEVRG